MIKYDVIKEIPIAKTYPAADVLEDAPVVNANIPVAVLLNDVPAAELLKDVPAANMMRTSLWPMCARMSLPARHMRDTVNLQQLMRPGLDWAP